MNPVLLTGLLGAWLAADATALAQLMVSQPLVGGALTGLVWGDWAHGLRVGALLQLYAVAGLPLGGRTPDDYAAGGVVGAGVAAVLAREAPHPFSASPVVLGVFAGFLVAVAGRFVVRWVRLRNEGLARWAEDEVRGGRAGALDRAQWLGVGHAAAVGGAFTLAALAVCVPVMRWLVGFDALAVQRAAAVAEPALWGVGAGVMARQLLPASRGAVVLFVAALAFLLALRLSGTR